MSVVITRLIPNQLTFADFADTEIYFKIDPVIKIQKNRWHYGIGEIVDRGPILSAVGFRGLKEFELDLYNMGIRFIPNLNEKL